jgi:hypothetical protein
MMAVIFAAMLLAMALAELRQPRLAIAAVVGCLVIAVHQFLWEVHSDVYGYGLPWLDW